MTKFFDIDAANEALVEVGPLLATLADQRAELIRLRDRTLAAHAAASSGGPAEIDEDAAVLANLARDQPGGGVA